MPFDLGDTVRLAAECTDAGGTLSNAGTATLTITLPDGTTATPAVSAPAVTGQYSLDYVTTQPGRHSVRWLFANPASAYTDVFDVREDTPPLILSLADAKAQLNIKTTRDDDELRSWTEAVTTVVEDLAGVCVRRSFTEEHPMPFAGSPTLALNRTPAVSLTSVTDLVYGNVYPVADLLLDTSTGIVQHSLGCRLYGTLSVTYVAGRPVVPANITAAAKIILQHLWQSVRTGSRSPGRSDDVTTIPGFGYAIPNRALQLLEPHRLPPGVA